MELLSFLPSDSTNRSSNKSVLRKYLNLVILVLILLIGSLNLLNIFTKKLDNKQFNEMISNLLNKTLKT